MKKLLWVNFLWVLTLGAGVAFADEDTIVSSDAAQVEAKLSEQVSSQLITEEQAEEMGLNRADTYEVSSTVSVENLELLIAEKLKEREMPYYSIEFNDPTQDNEFRATVTEYFSPVNDE
ncbi:hypothetical protein VV869_04535 [Photobacterium sp. MCCC 1A19761]|uniref:hypothetical protein n=1 Tax=Photobacterium sp. MCCC 1A19761 TaxID=3115000 RepID=UPI00307F79CC